MNYKFYPDDDVSIMSYVGTIIHAKVFSRYTSDTENHPADAHNRYVVIDLKGNPHDVYEGELFDGYVVE